MKHMRAMHELKLCSSLGLLSHISITMMNNCVDFMSTVNQCEVYKYQADCLFANKEFQKAYIFYNKALQTYKSSSKAKLKHDYINLQHLFIDVDIKYKIYQCCMALNKDYEALNVLESISQKSRKPKIHFALAQLYQKMNMEKSAIVNYKEVLKVCPLALDCAIELLRLGEHPNVVISVMNIHCILDWLVPYIKAHGVKYSKDFLKCVPLFEALSSRVNLCGNPSILYDLATSFYTCGNTHAALQSFKACHLQDPNWLLGMDLYAYLLCEDEQSDELDKLSANLFSVSQIHPEPWVAMGYLAKSKGDHSKSLYLATRATELDSTCIQALLLRGVILCLLNEAKIAVTHFRRAMSLAPGRLDCYAELVSCYISEHRNNEAINIAKSALDCVGYIPDSLVLCAAAYLNNLVYNQANQMVERALSLNANHKQAIEIRCTIAQRQEKYSEAIVLLKDAVKNHNSSVLHAMLAECYCKTSRYSEAVNHFNIALSLDSNNAKAKQGLEKIQVLEQDPNFDTCQDGDNVHSQHTAMVEENAVSTVAWPHDDWF